MNKAIGLIFVFILLALPIAVAEPAYYFKQSTEVELKIFCFENNNSLCSGALCQLNVLYPNQTILINNQSMTNSFSYFNYTLNKTHTAFIGEYPVTVTCQGTGDDGYETFSYEVTKSGEKQEYSGSGSIAITIFILIITIAVFYMGFSGKNYSSYKYLNFIIKRGLILLGIYLMVLNSAIMATIAEFIGIDLTTEMFMFMEIFGWAGYIAMVILVIGTLIQLLHELKKDKHEDRIGGYEDYD